MPKLHPRTAIVQKANLAIREAITDTIAHHEDLTYIELLGILHEIRRSWLKYALRAERHPDDPEKPAGLE